MDTKLFQLQSLTREEFLEHQKLGHFKCAIVPIGSIEQHLNHLSMSMDIDMSRFIAEQAAEKLYPNVLITSPVSFGIAEHHMFCPGTISAKPGSFLSSIFDVLESLLRHGVIKILLLNGHGGNISPINGIFEQWKLNLIATQNTSVELINKKVINNHYEYIDALLGNKKNRIDIRFNSYWDFIPEEMINSILETKEYPGHAGEFETSLAMYALPNIVRLDKLQSSNEIGIQKSSSRKGEKLAIQSINGVVNSINEMLFSNKGKDNTTGKMATVASLQLCEASRAPMATKTQISVKANYGIVGDRHAKENGKRQILILDKEILDRFQLPIGTLRENITVENLRSQQMTAGTRIAIGAEVILELTGDCAPCSRMDEIKEGLQKQLVGQRGMLAKVIEGGTVKTGESITLQA